MTLEQVIRESEEMLEKGITASQISETANGATLRPPLDLVPFITDVADRKTPVADMLIPRAKKGIGKAHVFNKMLSYVASGENLRDAFYGDGALPREATTAYSQVSVPFKSLGYSGGVTGLAEDQGGDFLDLYAREVQTKMLLTKAALEWNFFNGSTTIASPNTTQFQFAGLNELVTQSVDAGGDKLQGTTGKAIINKAANIIAQNGGMATHLLVDLSTQANILDANYNSNSNLVRIEASGNTSTVWGTNTNRISTQAGEVLVVGDFFLNPGNTYTLPNGSQSTPSGATTATAYLVNMDFINFVYLGSSMMRLETIGRTKDEFEFFVKCYAVLEALATEYCVKITNISTDLD